MAATNGYLYDNPNSGTANIAIMKQTLHDELHSNNYVQSDFLNEDN